MSLLSFCEWLANTQWSISLHESEYAYAIIESVHVWTLCLFAGFAAILDLRLLGVMMPRVPVSQLAQRLLPWTLAGFVVMVATGILLFYAIPVRTYQNVFFRFKVVMLVLAGINTFVFHNGIYRTIQTWDLAPIPPRGARLAGMFSLGLWALIIVAGRMIAYNWYDCDSVTSTVMRTLAGCGPLLPFFEWCESTAIGAAIRESTWLFPVIEAFHLLGLAMLGGAVLLLNLRLMGFVLRQHSVAAMTRDAMPWIVRSVIVMLVSGVLLFLSEAVKCYYSMPFWLKMYGLAAALVFTFTAWRAVATSETRGNAGYARVVALVSIALWAVVGFGGRWIGFA